MYDSTYSMKKWAKIYDKPESYAKKVIYNPKETRVAIMLRLTVSPEVEETYIYTMQASTGASIT